MDKFDVIVIGSGIGGMTSASALANKGLRVLVLEAHSLLGGYCQSFPRKDFTFYSAVLKTCGKKFKGVVDGFYDELGMERIEWIEFPEYVYVENEKYILGEEPFLRQAHESFPDEREAIEAFENTINRLCSILQKVDEATQQKNMKLIDLKDLAYLQKYRKVTLKDLVDQYFTDERLKTTIIAMVDGKPHSSIFAFVFTVMFAFRGARMYQPKYGGFYRVICDLERFITRHGGEVRKNLPVKKVIVENGKAVGVRCANGDEFYAEVIISNADMGETLKMLDEEHIPKNYFNKVNEIWKTSCSCFTVWLGLNKTLEELNIPVISASFYRKNGFYKKLEILVENSKYNEDDSIFFSTTTSLDKSCTPEGKSQIIIGMLVGKNFENLWEQHGTLYYKERKKEIAGKLVRRVEEILGMDITPYIEVAASATPYTYYRYTKNKNGATEGFEVTPDYINDPGVLRNSPIIEGLYASSQWHDDGGGVVAVMVYSMKVIDVLLKKFDKPSYNFLEKYFAF